MNKIYLNENDILKCLTKANKSWLTRYINKQKTYGNKDIISCSVEKLDMDSYEVEVNVGESWAYFRKNRWGANKDTYVRDYGNLYHEEQVTKLVNELMTKISW